MAVYADIKTLPEMRALAELQLAKAFYDIESTRDVLRSKEPLPAVGTDYVLIEQGRFSSLGDLFGEEIYETSPATVPVTFQHDQVKYYRQEFTITAASKDPTAYLMLFNEQLQDKDWYDPLFKNLGLSLLEVSDISEADLPSEGGDWEIRSVISFAITYVARRNKVIETVDKITGNVVIKE